MSIFCIAYKIPFSRERGMADTNIVFVKNVVTAKDALCKHVRAIGRELSSCDEETLSHYFASRKYLCYDEKDQIVLNSWNKAIYAKSDGERLSKMKAFYKTNSEAIANKLLRLADSDVITVFSVTDEVNAEEDDEEGVLSGPGLPIPTGCNETQVASQPAPAFPPLMSDADRALLPAVPLPAIRAYPFRDGLLRTALTNIIVKQEDNADIAIGYVATNDNKPDIQKTILPLTEELVKVAKSSGFTIPAKAN